MGNKMLTDGTEIEAEVQTVKIRKPRSAETRLALRTKKTGMFARKPRRVLTPSQIVAATTVKLTQPAAEGENTPFERIIDSMTELAADSRDPKEASARVKAAELLVKVMGIPEKKEPEQHKIKIVMVGFPENMMNTEVSAYEDRPKPPTMPAFTEVTEIVTNEPTKE
jgi:hypothetical protein